MTKIRDLAFTDRDRTAGNWRVKVREYEYSLDHELYHHGTLMLIWNTESHSQYGVLTEAAGYLGYGSVSDQQGMNQLLWELNLPVYYSRNKGAHFEPRLNANPAELDLSVPGRFYYDPPQRVIP